MKDVGVAWRRGLVSIFTGIFCLFPLSSFPLDVVTAQLVQGVQWNLYSQTLEATNGALPYAWQVASTSLPDGVWTTCRVTRAQAYFEYLSGSNAFAGVTTTNSSAGELFCPIKAVEESFSVR